MGTALMPIGNHNIRFKNRSYLELATEIKNTLDNIRLSNAEFLRLSALNLHWNDRKTIKRINSRNDWLFDKDDRYGDFSEHRRIEFNGPFDLELDFDEYRIIFWTPRYSYYSWFEMEDNERRNGWRKYMRQVVNLFGGDRVIYLPDNGHPLEEHLYFESPLEKIEALMRKAYGLPQKTFATVAKDFDHFYFIDRFEDLM